MLEFNEILSILQDHAGFTLTGSQYFGGQHQLSDWDFFTENNKETADLLSAMGFRQVPLGSYDGDPNIEVVWEFVGYDNICQQMNNIHIQCVRDVDDKLSIQQCLKEMGMMSTASKSRRKHFWMVLGKYVF